MQSELLDAVLTALNDVALDHQIGDEEMIHLVAANLGRLIVFAADGDTVRFQELVRGATESISAGFSANEMPIQDRD